MISISLLLFFYFSLFFPTLLESLRENRHYWNFFLHIYVGISLKHMNLFLHKCNSNTTLNYNDSLVICNTWLRITFSWLLWKCLFIVYLLEMGPSYGAHILFSFKFLKSLLMWSNPAFILKSLAIELL